MEKPSALLAALAITHTPLKVRAQHNAPLPDGVVLLLKVASGDTNAISQAQALTERTAPVLRTAAGFFIEQILLSQDSDSYRILGLNSDASSNELRSHMALLMKWLHPDVAGMNADEGAIDRTIFINRVTSAWENLKTADRRKAYDKKLASAKHHVGLNKRQLSKRSKRKQRHGKKLEMHRIERVSLLQRFLRRLRTHT